MADDKIEMNVSESEVSLESGNVSVEDAGIPKWDPETKKGWKGPVVNQHKLSAEDKSAGGKASSAKARQFRDFKECLDYLLKQENPETGRTYLEDINLQQLLKAMKGDRKSAEYVRDSSVGKPVQQVSVSSNSISIKVSDDNQVTVSDTPEDTSTNQ